MKRVHVLLVYVTSIVILGIASLAAAPPDLPDGSEKARKAMAAFRVPKGFQVELFAAEPMLASPVAFCLDEKGRIFVAEEYRFNQGTEENRTRPFLLEDDLQIRTLDDRLRVYQKWASKFDGGMNWFSKHSDVVRLLEDRNGDGKADFSSVFAEGFNDPLDGLAAGIIARDGEIYFTCIPNLWLLRDTKGDGKADVRKSLLRGFGVNCAFLGHDLHGLAWGPDGKLYFSVGDRGYHVETEGKTFSGPRNGAVFRCNPDGSEFEVVHRGLRNPQELAFDQYGNLFADDNNCDKGDHARLVYVVEEGDSGWNMAYQTIPEPYLTGPWFAEKMWHLPHSGQPAWLTPPVGKIGTGPSGFCFTSGLSLPERYRNRFFMANYTGNGGIESFGVQPKGAGFEIVDYHDFLKPVMATDVDFGYDGKMYISDFVGLNWNGGSQGGRIFTVFDPERRQDPSVIETEKLFREGFRQRGLKELSKLLAHPDQRVRQRAQFTLADRAKASKDAAAIVGELIRVSKEDENTFARLHALWCLGQLARTHAAAAERIVAMLEDPSPEIQAQAAKLAGDHPIAGVDARLVRLLTSAEPRVKYFAAMSLGKRRYRPAIDMLFTLLKDDPQNDPYLRHAAVTALTRIGDADAVAARSNDPSAKVRMGVVLVQRRLKDARIANMLKDSDGLIVIEAARAIYDVPIEGAEPALREILPRFMGQTNVDHEPLLRRAISGHFRNGTAHDAEMVLAVALNDRFPMTMRTEAINALRDWADPPQRDRVTGFWRPLPKRDAALITRVLDAKTDVVLEKTSGTIQAGLIRLLAQYGANVNEERLQAWVSDEQHPSHARIAALHYLAVKQSPRFSAALASAEKSNSSRLRAEARDLLLSKDQTKGLLSLKHALEGDAEVFEKQRALIAIRQVKGPEKNSILDGWARRLGEGKVAPELVLDVIEALQASTVEKHQQTVQRFLRTFPATPTGKYVHALMGGDAEKGREIFVGHAAAQCIRCHTVEGKGGTAGPDLSRIVTRYPQNPREHFLESMVHPNAKITPGFGNITVTTVVGKTLAGILLSEDADSVTIQIPEGPKVTIRKDDIEARSVPNSAMPSMEKTLTPRELRDLVAYLMTLK